MDSSPKRVLLTGVPGIGKTTLIKKACEKLKTENKQINGFYTSEIRNPNTSKREGFDVISLDGTHKRLATAVHLLKPSDITRDRVGQYCVYTKDFEDFVLPIFDVPKDVLIVDEIGKMELFSVKFKNVIQDVFKKSNVDILGTIPVARGRPYVVKQILETNPNCIIINVDAENRNKLIDEIVSYFM